MCVLRVCVCVIKVCGECVYVYAHIQYTEGVWWGCVL
jgi:hypothetical protein